ncbi:MAG: hypothetical protein IPH22_12545 [Nitrosomonas sp.]|nr:hypothetical protein [Nitrosomonas sp.]
MGKPVLKGIRWLLRRTLTNLMTSAIETSTSDEEALKLHHEPLALPIT